MPSFDKVAFFSIFHEVTISMCRNFLLFLILTAAILLILLEKCESSDMDTKSKYQSFSELCQNEHEYEITFRLARDSTIAIIAPHGGGIEPGTSELARAIAGSEYTFYAFIGLKKEGNSDLHLPSGKFDEPVGCRIVANSETTIAIHGCSGDSEVVYLGGLDIDLKLKIKKRLQESFLVRDHPDFPGTDSLNICNQNLKNAGVQIEISTGLRRKMFEDLSRQGREKATDYFYKFVDILTKVLSELK